MLMNETEKNEKDRRVADMKKEDCVFCKIANGNIPSKTLYEDGSFRVILD